MAGALLDVKRAAYEMLGERFKGGGYEGAEAVDVFYGWKDVRSRNRFVVVGGGDVRYETQRLADALAQYDTIATFTVAACSGLDMYDEMTAERNSHSIMEVVKDVLLRDEGAEISRRVAGIFSISPATEDYSIRVGEERKPQWSVLELTIEASIIRS